MQVHQQPAAAAAAAADKALGCSCVHRHPCNDLPRDILHGKHRSLWDKPMLWFSEGVRTLPTWPPVPLSFHHNPMYCLWNTQDLIGWEGSSEGLSKQQQTLRMARVDTLGYTSWHTCRYCFSAALLNGAVMAAYSA
jgi:hypothetical protein